MIDKVQVARQFSRAAEDYKKVSIIQNQMAEELLLRLPKELVAPKNILDLGCGSGYLITQLADRFKASEVTGLDIAAGMIEAAKEDCSLSNSLVCNKRNLIQADMESLPIAAESFELVVSNAALQWTDCRVSLAEIERILVPGGTALLATFVEGTLQEWRRALQSIGLNLAHEMLDLENLVGLTKQLNFKLLASDSLEHRLEHTDVSDLLTSTKRVGATNALKDRSRGLMGRGTYKALLNAIEDQFPEGDYFSSYRSGYLILRKSL